MQMLILGLSGFGLFLALGAIFVIVFLTIHHVLDQYSLFVNRGSIVTVALCVSLLCVIGLNQSFLRLEKTDEEADKGIENNFKPELGLRMILLPYGALSIVILVSLLVFIAHNSVGTYKPGRSVRRITARTVSHDLREAEFVRRLAETQPQDEQENHDSSAV